MLAERHESDKQTEMNLDNMRPDHELTSDELENIYANTQIYMNTNMLGISDYSNANCMNSFRKKPALPPKPSSQVDARKQKRSTTSTAVAPTILHPKNGEHSVLKDPAEMSLKERMALFEQSTRNIRSIETAPRVQIQSAPMTLPKKHSQFSARTTESAAIIHATLSNEMSKSKFRHAFFPEINER